MKKLSLLILSVLFLTPGLSLAQESQEISCTSGKPGARHIFAKLILADHNILVQGQVGFHNFNLLCSYRNNCVGFEFGSSTIEEGRAVIVRNADQRIIGFTFDDHSFSCGVPSAN